MARRVRRRRAKLEYCYCPVESARIEQGKSLILLHSRPLPRTTPFVCHKSPAIVLRTVATSISLHLVTGQTSRHPCGKDRYMVHNHLLTSDRSIDDDHDASLLTFTNRACAHGSLRLLPGSCTSNDVAAYQLVPWLHKPHLRPLGHVQDMCSSCGLAERPQWLH